MTKLQPLITGIGAISAAGANLAETLTGFAASTRHAGPLTLFPFALDNPVFQAPLPLETDKNVCPTLQSRTLQLALGAVHEALAMAALASAQLATLRVGVCLGTTVECQFTDTDFYADFRQDAHRNLEPVQRYLQQNLAEAVAASVGATGPCTTIVNACASGTDAIGVAASWIRQGLCDIAIAGGADELNRIPCSGFASLGVVSPMPCAPFDRDRQGLNLGEGAGILILEHPDCRRRPPLPGGTLAVAGYGNAADAYHMTAPHPQGRGLESAIRAALAEAGIGPEAVAFVNAHGTATRDNDLVEGNTLARVFGPALPFLSTKGFTGHTLGAAGGLEAAFTAAALLHRWLPASPGWQNPDPDIPITPLARRTEVHGHYSMSTSLAFGGSNAAIIIKYNIQ